MEYIYIYVFAFSFVCCFFGVVVANFNLATPSRDVLIDRAMPNVLRVAIDDDTC